ncbi:MAG: 50S ribosomal protein L21e [Nanoarchaeota archaeon]
MIKRKQVKQRGKIRLSEYFKNLKDGERVAIVRELSENPKFPYQLQGRSGVIAGKRGGAYIVKIMDFDQEKTHIIQAIHLKKLK